MSTEAFTAARGRQRLCRDFKISAELWKLTSSPWVPAVLAIYLDPKEPTNIVEAYTFTFRYETDAQGNKVRCSTSPWDSRAMN